MERNVEMGEQLSILRTSLGTLYPSKKTRERTDNSLISVLLFMLILFSPLLSIGQEKQSTIPVFNVLKYGAVGDGKVLDTNAFQNAIDE